MLQDRVEALGEVGDDVIVVERPAVVGVKGGRRAADQDRARDERLQAGGLLQDLIERWLDGRYVIRSDKSGPERE